MIITNYLKRKEISETLTSISNRSNRNISVTIRYTLAYCTVFTKKQKPTTNWEKVCTYIVFSRSSPFHVIT